MITRRNLLKGMVAGIAGASVAASTLIRKNKGLNVLEAADTNTVRSPWRGQGTYQVYDRPMVQDVGFGLARAKPEGGTYYVDPMDDPEYRGQHGQGGKYAHGHQS